MKAMCFAFKRISFFTLLLFVPCGLFAQGLQERLSFALARENYCHKYEYPVQEIECGGNRFKAEAQAEYTYYPDKGHYGIFVLRVLLKPLNTEGICAQDSVVKYEGYGTYVYHESFDLKGPVRKLNGSVDAYSRVFDVHPPAGDDELKLEYSAVFDVEHPGSSKIKYKLYKSAWAKSDKAVYYDKMPDKYYEALWRDVKLHDMGYFAIPGADNHFWDKATLVARMNCFQEEKDIKEPGTSLNSTKPGKIKVFMNFGIEGMYEGKHNSMYNLVAGYPFSYENNTFRCAESLTSNGEVTLEEKSFINLGNYQPFFVNRSWGYFGFSFRAHAKCRYVTSPGRTGGERQLYIEQASFSHVLYN